MSSDEWKPLEISSPFVGHVGPIMIREANGFVELMLEVQEQHGNIRGHTHGGMIATFADIALGRNLAKMSRPDRYYVTTNLNVTYLNATEKGDVLIARIDKVRAGSRTGFVHGRIIAGDRDVAEINGVFCGIETKVPMPT